MLRHRRSDHRRSRHDHDSVARRRLKPLCLAAAGAATLVGGEVSAQTTISYSTGTYSQNFNTLPNAGSFALGGAGPFELSGPPVFAFGLGGWTMAKRGGSGTNLAFRVNGGTEIDGAVYSYGAGTSIERALGSLASASVVGSFGATFINTGSITLNQFTLSYTGEQWRRGSGAANSLAFSYGIDAADILAGGFTAVPELSFTAPITEGASVALNGNDPANRVAISHTVTNLSWAPGQSLVLRWSDTDDAGADDGLAIDDLAFSAAFVVGPRNLVWNPSAFLSSRSNTWNTDAGNTNWLLDAAPAAFMNGDLANFTDTGVGAVNVDGGGVQPAAINVSNTTGFYTFSGGPVGGAGTLTKSGAGTLELQSPNSYSGGTRLNGGWIVVASDAALGAAGGSLSFNGGTLQIGAAGFASMRSVQATGNGAHIDTAGFDASITGTITGNASLFKHGSGRLSVTNVRSAGLNVAAGEVQVLAGAASATPEGASAVGSLVLAGGPGAPTARLDLTNNAMIVSSTAAARGGPEAITDDIRSYIHSGYAGGSWAGAGIATSLGNANGSGLGYMPVTDAGTYLGLPVSPGDVIIRFTRFGDANIDGIVNLQDFNRLASNFGVSGGALWSQGDFNYDGVVNLQDFNRLAANFGLSAAGPDVTPEEWAALAAVVPEPLSGLCVAAVSALTGRRRRRSIAA